VTVGLQSHNHCMTCNTYCHPLMLSFCNSLASIHISMQSLVRQLLHPVPKSLKILLPSLHVTLCCNYSPNQQTPFYPPSGPLVVLPKLSIGSNNRSIYIMSWTLAVKAIYFCLPIRQCLMLFYIWITVQLPEQTL